MSAPKHSTQNQLFFYGLFAILSILVFWLISDFIGVIAFSLVMVIILKPVHDWFMRLVGQRAGLSTFLTIVTVLAILIIPSWFVVTVASNQLEAMIGNTETVDDLFAVEEFQGNFNELIQDLPLPGVENFEITSAQVDKIREAMAGAAQWAAQGLINLGMSLPMLLANSFIFLGIIGALLPNYHGFTARLRRLSPLDDDVDRLYLRKIKVMVWSMFVGIFIIAIIQGLMMGILYWIGALPLLGLWTILSIVAAMMPLGASLVAFPLGIIQLIQGNLVSGVIILAGYLLIVANVDNLIRPKLVSKEAYLNFVLILLSALGGYQLFGFFGVIYGPVLMILFLTTIDVYQEHYLIDNNNQELPDESKLNPTEIDDDGTHDGETGS